MSSGTQKTSGFPKRGAEPQKKDHPRLKKRQAVRPRVVFLASHAGVEIHGCGWNLFGVIRTPLAWCLRKITRKPSILVFTSQVSTHSFAISDSHLPPPQFSAPASISSEHFKGWPPKNSGLGATRPRIGHSKYSHVDGAKSWGKVLQSGSPPMVLFA